MVNTINMELGEVRTEEEIRSVYPLAQQFKSCPKSAEKFIEIINSGRESGLHVFAAFDNTGGGHEAVGSFYMDIFTHPLLGRGAYIGGLVIEKSYRAPTILQWLLDRLQRNLLAYGCTWSLYGRAEDDRQLDRFSTHFDYQSVGRMCSKDYNSKPFTPYALDGLQVEVADSFDKMLALVPMYRSYYPGEISDDRAEAFFQASWEDGFKAYYVAEGAGPVAALLVRPYSDPYWEPTLSADMACVGPQYAGAAQKLAQFFYNMAGAEKYPWATISLPIGEPWLYEAVEELGSDFGAIFYMRREQGG